MKQKTLRKLSLLLILALVLSFILTACAGVTPAETTAAPTESTVATTAATTAATTGKGDDPAKPPLAGKVAIDFYALNDIHGNVNGNERGVGIAKTATYLRAETAKNANTVLLSTGDAWQGSSESNNTKGALLTEWMNSLGFASMTLGNHEFDWSSAAIAENQKLAEFPLLAINVYEKTTGKLASYCTPSVLIERGGVKIGIIGAIGDCYSSISSGQVQDVRFLVGQELTALVKAESEKLRAQGAAVIVYTLHDGYGSSTYNSTGAKPISVSAAAMASYYDAALSDGYVDLVFEGHTHTSNVYTDPYGVYHLQAGGYNQGLSHVTLTYDADAKKVTVDKAELVFTTAFGSLETDSATTALLEKYADMIGDVNATIGYNGQDRGSAELRQLVADLYLKEGLAKWGADYDIFLAGGYISCRSPGYLAKGDVCYADLQTLFPFDNNLVLCAISGANLLSKFLNTTNENYFISLGEFGKANQKNVDLTKTYYVLTDTYSSDYAPNNLTLLEVYNDSGFYARDMLADYVRTGGFGKKPTSQTIADLRAEKDGVACEITAQVVAAYQAGFLLRDDTGMLLVYASTAYDGGATVGDTVKVTGTMGTYSGSRQITSPSYQVVSAGTAATPDVCAALNASHLTGYAQMDAYKPEYVRITGVLTVSGKYFNIKVDGTSVVGSIASPLNAAELTALNGKTVEVTGYFLYVSGSSIRYFTVLATEVKLVQSAALADYTVLLSLCASAAK